jgi:hypothetical protein
MGSRALKRAFRADEAAGMRSLTTLPVVAAVLIAASAGGTTLSTTILSSANGTDLFRCDVTNPSETKPVTAHVELIDGSGTVREMNDLVIPPLETREVAANDLQLAGRWCRVTFSGRKSKVRAALILFDGTRDALSLEAH